MANRKRIAALLLCIGLVLVLSVSAAYLSLEAGHDCSGEDCPVCLWLAVNLTLLRTLGLAFLLLSVLLPVLRDQTACRRLVRLCSAFPGTLVSWKIRLDN